MACDHNRVFREIDPAGTTFCAICGMDETEIIEMMIAGFPQVSP